MMKVKMSSFKILFAYNISKQGLYIRISALVSVFPRGVAWPQVARTTYNLKSSSVVQGGLSSEDVVIAEASPMLRQGTL